MISKFIFAFLARQNSKNLSVLENKDTFRGLIPA